MYKHARYILLAAIALVISSYANAERKHSTVPVGSVKPAESTSSAVVVPKAVSAATNVNTDLCRGSYQPTKTCDAIVANAAIDQVRYSHSQSMAAWVGVLVGTFTLLSAIAAAFYAKRAAEESRRSADVASSALNDSRENSAQETERFDSQLAVAQQAADATLQSVKLNRAWVHYGDFKTNHLRRQDGSYSYSFNVGFKNFGKTPALQVRTAVNMIVVNNTNQNPNMLRPALDPTVADKVLAPDIIFRTPPQQLSSADQVRLRSQNAYALIRVYIEYSDIFDPTIRREADFSLRVVAEGLKPNPDGGGMLVSFVVSQHDAIADIST